MEYNSEIQVCEKSEDDSFIRENDMMNNFEEDPTDGTLSALRESIKRKGNNSYYYAHGLRANGPSWDGKEEPRLLKVEKVSVASTKPILSFPSYAWADEKKNVKIYVEFANANEITDEDISLEWTPKSVKFVVKQQETDNVLSIDRLNDSIESATVRKKPTKFVITLTKTSQVSWYQLISSSS